MEFRTETNFEIQRMVDLILDIATNGGGTENLNG